MVGRKRKIERTPTSNPESAIKLAGLQIKNSEELAKNDDREYLDKMVMPALFLSLQELIRQRPDRPLLWLGEELIKRDKFQEAITINPLTLKVETPSPPETAENISLDSNMIIN